jgi:hypothetical protein
VPRLHTPHNIEILRVAVDCVIIIIVAGEVWISRNSHWHEVLSFCETVATSTRHWRVLVMMSFAAGYDFGVATSPALYLELFIEF